MQISFSNRSHPQIMSKSDESEPEWWWASNSQQQKGYVPRNLLSIYPRVTAKPKESVEAEDD